MHRTDGFKTWLFLTFAFLFAFVWVPAVYAQDTTQETTFETTGEDTTRGLQTPDPVVPGPDEECPGAQVVNTTTGNGDKQSPPFEITGERFRVTTTIVATSQDPELAVVSVFITTEDDDLATTISREGPGTDSSLVNAGPGGFFLDILSANAEYAITVEDCTETAQGDDDQNGDDGDDDDIVDDTIVKKPLPDTGGAPYFLLAGLALLGVTSAVRIFRS